MLVSDIHICTDTTNILIRDRKMDEMDENIYPEIFTFPVRDYYMRAGFDHSVEAYEDPASTDQKTRASRGNLAGIQPISYFFFRLKKLPILLKNPGFSSSCPVSSLFLSSRLNSLVSLRLRYSTGMVLE